MYTEQVFENLISNAIKFSPGRKKVFINLTLKDEHAIGEIKDEGPGMTEEDKKKLFGKYQKLSARPTGNEISTGLGLSIVKKFVDAMGGEIWCESEAGKGASFLVKLPLA
jgi:signal transduction histidine kinase